MSKEICDKIDAFLTLMACAEKPLVDYDGIYLYDMGVNANMQLGVSPLDVGKAWRATFNNQHGEYKDGIQLFDFQSVHWSKLSNLVGVGKEFTTSDFDCFSRMRLTVVDRKGTIAGQHNMVFGHNDHSIRIVDGFMAQDGNPMLKEGTKWFSKLAKLAICHALFEPSWWTVKVAIDPKCPMVSIPTDPTGIKEVWKLRDVAPGKKRRDALLHWVESHWRQNRVDPEMETMVRKHLRGSREFSCGDLRMQVRESEVDALKEWNAKQDRAIAKKKELDRRKRLMRR